MLMELMIGMMIDVDDGKVDDVNGVDDMNDDRC
jgi:hypothetical protein